MSLNNLTWQQVALVAILFGGTVAAHKFLGDGAGVAMAGLTSTIALLLGRSAPALPAPPPEEPHREG